MRTIALVSITLAPRNSATNHHCAAQPRHSFPARFCMSHCGPFQQDWGSAAFLRRAAVSGPLSSGPVVGGGRQPFRRFNAMTPKRNSPLTGPRPTTPIGILELVLGAEPTISRDRGHALLKGIEATIRSTSPATVLGTPRRGVCRLDPQQ